MQDAESAEDLLMTKHLVSLSKDSYRARHTHDHNHTSSLGHSHSNNTSSHDSSHPSPRDYTPPVPKIAFEEFPGKTAGG